MCKGGLSGEYSTFAVREYRLGAVEKNRGQWAVANLVRQVRDVELAIATIDESALGD